MIYLYNFVDFHVHSAICKSEPEVLITTLSRSALSRELRSLGKRGLADVGDPVLYLSQIWAEFCHLSR